MFSSIIESLGTIAKLHTRTPGDLLNVEVTVVAKYLERLCNPSH